jgi:hypothetical protein
VQEKTATRIKRTTAMTISKQIISAIALSGILFAGHAAASLAGEVNSSQTFKRFQGISFEAGQKHGVGYFYDNAGSCKLVLTLANASNGDNTESLTVTRYERAVPAGQITRYASEGRAFEFGCQANAEAMTFKPLSTVASAQSE